MLILFSLLTCIDNMIIKLKRFFFICIFFLLEKMSGKVSSKKQEQKFTPTVLINFLNSKYRNMEDKQISFKVAQSVKNDNKNVIDVNEYVGILELEQRYEEIHNSQGFNDLSSQRKMKLVIEKIFDFYMSSILQKISKYSIRPNEVDEQKYSVFRDEIISRLDFPIQKVFSLDDFYNIVDTFFASEQKLRTKIFNFVFPHGRHDEKTEEEVKNDKSLQNAGVKNIYLQHMPKYHEIIMRELINKKSDRESCLKTVRKLFIRDYTKLLETQISNNLDDDDREKENAKFHMVGSTMLSPEIFKLVGNKSDQKLNLNKIQRFDRTLIFDDDQQPVFIGSEEKKAVRALIRELNISSSFIKIINAGITYKNADNTYMQNCYQRYNDMYDKLTGFYKKEIKKPRKTMLNFLEYFIKCILFVSKQFNYQAPMKMFIKDTGSPHVFRFSKYMRTELQKFITQCQHNENSYEFDEETFSEFLKNEKVINELQQWEKPNITPILQYYNICSKIGKIVKINESIPQIDKQYRAGIGCAILRFVQDKIALIKASEKKNDITIYIKI